MGQSILSVLPLILLFLLGYLLKRARFFSSAVVVELKKFVSHVTLPALLFGAFFSIEFEKRYLSLVLLIFILCIVMVLLGRVIAKFLHIRSPYFSLMMGGFEMGMLGYALFIALVGEAHLGKMALVDLGQVLFVFFLLIPLLSLAKGEKMQFGTLIKQFLSSIVIIAIIGGLVGSFLKAFIKPNVVFLSLGHFLDLIGSLTLPLIALTIGYEIEIKKGNIGLSLKTIVVRKLLSILFLLVINEFFVTRLLKMESHYRLAMMVMFLTPPPFVISIFMDQKERKDVDYVSNTLSLDTVISVVLIVVMALFYR